MKFKVGDIVRPTREHIINAIENNTIGHLEYIDGFQVLKIEDNRVFYYINEKNAFYKAEHLELVPEEPEFEYGEEIEVSDDGQEWEKRIYLATVGVERKLHICVSDKSIERYKSGLTYNAASWEYVRKLKPQLTRKEIAEKFGVSEDFTLVD